VCAWLDKYITSVNKTKHSKLYLSRSGLYNVLIILEGASMLMFYNFTSALQ